MLLDELICHAMPPPVKHFPIRILLKSSTVIAKLFRAAQSRNSMGNIKATISVSLTCGRAPISNEMEANARGLRRHTLYATPRDGHKKPAAAQVCPGKVSGLARQAEVSDRGHASLSLYLWRAAETEKIKAARSPLSLQQIATKPLGSQPWRTAPGDGLMCENSKQCRAAQVSTFCLLVSPSAG